MELPDTQLPNSCSTKVGPASTCAEYGREVDIWAYGVVLFELLAGYNPFANDEVKDIFENILHGTINWPPYMHKQAKVSKPAIQP